jgi:hypothetical protein
MKEVIQHSEYGQIVFHESFWTGKKKISINGEEAKRISKKEYAINDKTMILNGSVLTGATLSVDGEVIRLSPKPMWYEVALSVIPFLLLMVWGNNRTLTTIFPVVGGAIGGALGAIGSITALLLMKRSDRILKKVLIGLASTVVTFLVAAIPSVVIVILYYLIFV